MTQPLRIALVTSDDSLGSHLQLRLQSKGHQAACMAAGQAVIGVFYADPPDLLIVDFASGYESAVEIISVLRSDSFFSTLPILGLINGSDCGSIDWGECPLDDFIRLPVDFGELFCRISLSLSRLKRVFDNNPLTRLPGNTSIQRAIEDSLGKAVSVCYVDINHFKPYNDVYGFSHGDEVIRMLARIIFNTVRDAGGGFCGHIGGDDFVFIVSSDQAAPVCQTVISHFDRIVLDLFEGETKERGYYIGTNRRGETEQIPLLAISIAVVPMDLPRLKHYAKVAEAAAELKKLAKESVTSRFVVEQRRS